LPAGAEDLIRVRARVAATVPPGTRLVNRAGVTAGSIEGPRADNAASAGLTVVPGGPAEVAVAAPPSVPVSDDATPVTVAVRDAGGNAVADGTEVRLTTSLGTLGSSQLHTAGGTVTTTLRPGHRVGQAVVRAQAGTVTAQQVVDVRPGPAVSVKVTPDDASPTVEESLALTVTVADAFGNPVADGSQVALATDLGTVTPAVAETAVGTVSAVWRSTTGGRGTVTAVADTGSGLGRATFRPGPPAVPTSTWPPT
jgi:uncharacterized Zn ribbon protein